MTKKILAVKLNEDEHLEKVQSVMSKYGFSPSVEHHNWHKIRYILAQINFHGATISNYGANETDPYLTNPNTKIVSSTDFLKSPILHLKYINSKLL